MLVLKTNRRRLRKNDRFEEDRCAIEKKHALRLQGSQRGWIKYRQSDNDP